MPYHSARGSQSANGPISAAIGTTQRPAHAASRSRSCTHTAMKKIGTPATIVLRPTTTRPQEERGDGPALGHGKQRKQRRAAAIHRRMSDRHEIRQVRVRQHCDRAGSATSTAPTRRPRHASYAHAIAHHPGTISAPTDCRRSADRRAARAGRETAPTARARTRAARPTARDKSCTDLRPRSTRRSAASITGSMSARLGSIGFSSICPTQCHAPAPTDRASHRRNRARDRPMQSMTWRAQKMTASTRRRR